MKLQRRSHRATDVTGMKRRIQLKDRTEVDAAAEVLLFGGFGFRQVLRACASCSNPSLVLNSFVADLCTECGMEGMETLSAVDLEGLDDTGYILSHRCVAEAVPCHILNLLKLEAGIGSGADSISLACSHEVVKVLFLSSSP